LTSTPSQATGCGKTHTISGTESDPGIIYLTMADLFQRIEDRRDEWDVEVMVTFLEIYNEEIRDLLAEPGSHVPRGGLSIREDKTVKVVGLVELKPRTAEEVKEIVLQGNLKRTQSPTHANETSSRSHAVLQVHVTQSPRTAAITEQRTMATLSIIDLAGSERAAATSNMGQRMVEGANINKSLLALGNCINALCESGGAIRHVPYRNSKLTRLLKFSLGGNCKTVMIVCVAPTSNHFDDTHNTLVYAERATKIKTKVVTRNVVNVDRHVGRYVEAINRLNSEILELKAKIAGKREAENDVVRRKKAEASTEVERAKKDMKTKVEQTKESIMDGASCTGKMTVAKVKLGVIRARLAQIDANGSSSSSTLSSDLEAERALLQALASPEEQVVKPESALNTRINRAHNSNAMFDATMRAVSERKSEKLDEVSVDNVKLDALSRKADMERLKAEGERDEMRKAVEDLAEVMIGLVGMLGRCTVVVGEAAEVLGGQIDGEGSSSTVQKVAKLLGVVRHNNDETFKKLLGHSTEGYAASARAAPTSLDSFSGYGTTFTRRISTGPAVLQTAANARGSNSRRSSAFGANSLAPPELRRSHRSPRKSLRSSLVSQPYRRVSDKEKKALKGGKNVQWRDEAGQGDLDDGGPKPAPVAVTIIPASPSNDVDANAASSSSAPILPPQRSTSLGGSESEWEDENEKTDDSINFMSMSLPPSTYNYPLNPPTTSRPLTAGGSRRSRPSRLDPSFLKSKSRGSALGSLVEGDENGSPERRDHHNPLSDMSMNQLSTSDDSSESGGHRTFSGSLHVPKVRDRSVHGSPGRRAPSTPKGGMGSGSGVGMAKSGSGRRRSNIGPLRNEKGRRRSSMIPQLSPPTDGSKNGARRVMLASPAKRVKRTSLTKSMSVGTLKLKSVASPPMSSMANFSMTGMDPNTSAEISFNKSFRPTWR
jgi:kinesin family protein 18/19